MRSREISFETAAHLRSVYNRFFTSTLSDEIDPIALLDLLIFFDILTENEANLVRSEQNLVKRQYWLFLQILPLKGEDAFFQLEIILCYRGYHIDPEKWISFFIDDLPTDQLSPESDAGAISSDSSGFPEIDFFGKFGSQIERDGLHTTPQPRNDRTPPEPFRSKECKSRKSPELPMEFSVKRESIENLKDIVGVDGTYGSLAVGCLNGSKVAVKKFKNPDTEMERKKWQKMFRAEIDILRKLKHFNHPNILDFIGFVYEPEQLNLWIITEYIEGGSMERFRPLGRQLIDLIYIIEISKQCWRGLAYLHEKSLWHRDISPDNILVSLDKKKVKIADFGHSEFKDWTTVSLRTECRFHFFGKTPYMPPECLIKNEPSGWDWKYFDGWNWERLDIYAMGATLCQFSSGQYFWRFDLSADSDTRNAEISEKLLRWADGKISSPECWDAIPLEIRQILQGAIQPDYKKRKSAQELCQEFEKLQMDRKDDMFL